MTQSKLLLTFLGILLTFSVVGYVKLHSYQKEVYRLNNELVLKDKTIEIKDGLFAKHASELNDLNALLDLRDKQLAALRTQIKTGKEKLFSVTKMSVHWKSAYEVLLKQGNGVDQSVLPSTVIGQPDRTKVEFAKDFGYIGVNGYTLTNPAEAFIKVQQNRPLRLAVAISRTKDGKWNAYATSSEENVAVNVDVAGVDTKMFKKRWYEKLSVSAVGGLNKNSGFLSVGPSYTFDINKNWSVWPSVWITPGTKPDPVFVVGTTWHPFARE